MTLFNFVCLLSCLSLGFLNDVPLGVFVRQDNHSQRIEFLSDGSYLRRDRYHLTKGKFTKVQDELICLEGDEPERDELELRFRWKDKLLVDPTGSQWMPREDVLSMPWQDVSPVKLTVRDEATGKPVDKFTYDYTLANSEASFDPLLVRPVEVQSADGSIVLSAPQSCRIQLDIRSEAIYDFAGSEGIYHLTTNNEDRELEVRLEMGQTLSGLVVDGASGQPIQGARVAPNVFVNPITQPDLDRAVFTDEKGQFAITGLSKEQISLNVWHSDYLESGWYASAENGRFREDLTSLRIEMETGERFWGVVTDPAGNVIAGVSVDDGAGKLVKTNRRGEFELRSPEKWDGDQDDQPNYNLSFEKTGFARRVVMPRAADVQGYSIVLEALPTLKIRVVDPEGSPVTKFDVSAGVGLEPRPWRCTSISLLNSEAHASLHASLQVETDPDDEDSGKVWIGVKANGFALGESTVDNWQGTREVTINLRRGVTVTGTVAAAPDRLKDISIEILPRKLRHRDRSNGSSQRQEMMRRKTILDQEGRFQFENIAPGTYTLVVYGPLISPTSAVVSVLETNLDIGQIKPLGLGKVTGTAFKSAPHSPQVQRVSEKDRENVWAFKEGYIYFQDDRQLAKVEEFPHLKPIPFWTDENGQFEVKGVPVGAVTISFFLDRNSDILLSQNTEINVKENETSVVND